MITACASTKLGHSERLFPALALAFWTIPWVYSPSKIVVVLVGDPVGEPPGWTADTGAAAGGGVGSGTQAETAKSDIPTRNNCFI
jgi:hypothetical protein